MKKIKINMLSSAEKVKGQGVASAYRELINLLNEKAKEEFDISINSKKKTDIIHAHTVNFGYYLKLKFNKRKNKIAYVHFLPQTLDGSIKLPKLFEFVFKKYVMSFYRTCDYLVVVNPIFINELVSYKIPREKIHYIPNFVSKKTFYRQEKDVISKTRKKYNIKDTDFVVLSAGQVQHRKGVKDFVECAKKMPDVTFLWCGGFSFGKITHGYEELKEIYENPPKNVKFIGIIPRNEMNDIINAADLFFLASFNELFPMAILEALSCEKPVMLRNLELYEDILFKKYEAASDIEGFCNLIEKFKTDNKFYEAKVKDSIEISDFYSDESVLKKWIEFYTMVYKNSNTKNKDNK